VTGDEIGGDLGFVLEHGRRHFPRGGGPLLHVGPANRKLPLGANHTPNRHHCARRPHASKRVFQKRNLPAGDDRECRSERCCAPP
jgi:hypothetical protein